MEATDGSNGDCEVLPADPDDFVERSRSGLLRVAAASECVACGAELTDEKCPVYGDLPRDMTGGRLVARFLSRYRWYYPRREDGSGPDLDTAWSHYEHWTLARFYLDQCGGGPHGRRDLLDGGDMVRAQRGERDRPTALYPVWGTPLRELADFGVSVRMHFSTLRALAAFLLVAGVLNLPLAGYFWSYGSKGGIDGSVKGSALCDDTEWVECESCNTYPDMYPSYRLDGQNALRNICNFEDWLVPGLFGYASTVVLLALFGIWFYLWQSRVEVAFDEDVQTASDYSIKVTNPPPDATDPEEWRRFMDQFVPGDSSGGVVACTVALDNRKLIKALITRRRMLQDLAKVLPYGVDMTDTAAVAEAVDETTKSKWGRIPFLPGPNDRYTRIKDLEETIRELTQREYRAVAIFVTFETERGQRNALHALSTGRMNVWRNKLDNSKLAGGKTLVVRESAQNTTESFRKVLSASITQEETETHTIHLGMRDDLLFRSKKVLYVKEAPEPNDVCWKDLQVPKRVQALHFVGTTLVLIAFICWSGYFINHLVRVHPGEPHAAVYIAVTNVLVPRICEAISEFERHATEAGRQSSLYVKMALFRWFNSAIALSVVFSFIETISIEDGNEDGEQSLIYSVAPIMFAELFAVPMIKLLDPIGKVRRHILAPRALDQQAMNSFFSGEKLDLADLSTDATKVVFVALFYAAIYPPALFLGALTLVLQTVAYKFCLLRLWGPTPDVGHHLARMSRNYFFSTTLVTHVVMGAYWWSGYPYDHICGDADSGYYHCSQDFLRQSVFPPLPRFQPEGGEWMTESQEQLTSLYGWTSVAALTCAAFAFFKHLVLPSIVGIFRSTYEPDGRDQNLNFSDVQHLHEVLGYVPQEHESGFSHPLLACDIRGIGGDLVGWRDHQHSHSIHNLFDDACTILGAKPISPAFSIVRQWNTRKTSQS